MDAPLCANHLKISLPMAFQFSITAIGGIVLQGAINSFGSSVVAAYTAACKVEQLANQPLVTFGATMATYSAQNLGAGNIRPHPHGREPVRRDFHDLQRGLRPAHPLLRRRLCAALPQRRPAGNHAICKAISQYHRGVCVRAGFAVHLPERAAGHRLWLCPHDGGRCELVARVLVALLLARYIGYTAICLAGPSLDRRRYSPGGKLLLPHAHPARKSPPKRLVMHLLFPVSDLETGIFIAPQFRILAAVLFRI